MGIPFLKLSPLLLLLLLTGCCAGTPQKLPMDPSVAEPPVVFEMPEIICVAEKQDIAFVPDLPIDIFNYGSKWFWKIRDTWYWSRTYMGMLYELTPKQVPKRLRKFGDNYRTTLTDCREFTYDDWYRRTRQP